MKKNHVTTSLLHFLNSLLLISCMLSSLANAQTIEEIRITLDYIPDEKLTTAEVSETLSAEDIGIAGDSNVGEALKRLPGLSLVDGQYIYVRGMGERYSSTYFNGSLIPSPQPLQRAVPLDLFDASVISNVLVQKTFSPNYGAEFSGGVVDIRSAAIPDEDFFKIKISSSHNSISTNKKGMTYTGGNKDFWGHDDGKREFSSFLDTNIDRYPNIFEGPNNNPPGLSAAGQDSVRLGFLNNNWSIRKRQNPLDLGLSTALGKRWKTTEDLEIGLLLVGAFDNKWRNRLTERTRYSQLQVSSTNTFSPVEIKQRRQDALNEGALSVSGISDVSNYDRTINSIGVNLMSSLGLQWEAHTVKLTTLLTRKTTDEASIETGRNSNAGEDVLRNDYRLQWTENEILFNQLSGEHYFKVFSLKWRYADIEAKRDAPDIRTYRYSTTFNSSVLPEVSRLPPTSASGRPAREFTFLTDSSKEYGIDLEIPLYHPMFEDVTLKVGFSALDKDRQYRGYRFEYVLDNLGTSGPAPLTSFTFLDPIYERSLETLLDPSNCIAGAAVSLTDNCYLNTGFVGLGTSTPQGTIAITDGFFPGQNKPESYDASFSTNAFYFMLDIQVNEFWHLSIGARRESSKQAVFNPLNGELLTSEVDKRAFSAGNVTREEIEPRIHKDYMLPAVSMTWDFYDNMQLRAAYSESINRPILRELAPVSVFNPDNGRQYIGNPKLEIAEITSKDLRYEWFFGEGNYLSISWFNKHLDTPTELFETTIGDEPVFQWQNVPAAENEGYEFELQKYLGEYWYIIANATLIDSTVDLPQSLINFGQSQSRPLQGLSEKIYNTQAVFKNDSLTASLAYNKFSERIYAIIDGLGETYEQPFESLDFNIKSQFYTGDEVFSIGFKVQNILEEETVIQYKNGLPYDEYKKGMAVSLSLEWQHY